MSDLRLIIFDVDGTLVDSQSHIAAAMEAAFVAEGLPVPPQSQVLGVVGLSLEVAMATLVPELDAPQRARMVETYRAAFFAHRVGNAASPLYPGARGALEVLAGVETHLLGIATGKSLRGLDHILEAHGLGHHFVTLQVADHHPSKPHPAMVLAALAETGVPPENAVMIGDTEYDIEMGRAAGVRTLGVGWGYHPPDRLGAADAVVAGFAALPAAVNGLWRG
ncbi:phosphoglycolate phosphatase [Rhodovulum sp. ES.010]|uniref:HAD-IA family hydrolase n=1 Tax=Rhodovulum sp. ES.010 TaxID=1882821 RepID=UPI000926ED82|nr:HAD-IA family hydrolase [Rhodovulum sp. ES.010]SIO52795.1 phosphoglycolate phosphatase [Rhodovulum sp. ES.010]